MNTIGEFDLELLEDYLDDALSPGQVEHVAQRLADEPELALAMHELRAGRVLRNAAFRAMEPDEAEASAVADRVSAFVRTESRRARTRWAGRIGWGVAAALVLVAVGWALHASDVSPNAPRAQVPNAGTAIAIESSPAAYHLPSTDGSQTPELAQDLVKYEASRREAEQGAAVLVSDHF